LKMAHVYVFSTGKFVLVQDVVLRSSSVQPGGPFRLNKHTSRSEDVYRGRC
jgi:hypothetical protein